MEMTEQEKKVLEEKAEKNLANQILKPVSNAEFDKFVKDMGLMFEIAGRYAQNPIIEKATTKKFDEKIFSARLKVLLEKGNISQKALAEYLGISQQQVSNYKSGANMPSVDMLCNIANYFKCSVDWLLGIESDRVKATREMLIKQAQDELLDKVIEFCKGLKR